MDELGPLGVEFVINVPEVLAQSKQVEAALQGVTDTVQAQTAQATAAITGTIKAATNTQFTAIERLKIQLAEYRVSAELALNPARLALYNQKIEETIAEIARLNNVGKAGFDVFGNKLPVEQLGKFEAAIGRVTDVSNIGARVVTQFSRQIIGLGVGLLSGIVGAKAIEALVTYISNLDVFTGRLNQLKQNQIALNEVMADADKDAGKQISNLKILYAAATDVTNSVKDRTAAARELKKEYPDAFANSKISAILNGEESKTYQQLTKDVLENARAKAAASKIADLASKQLDLDFQRDKINYAKAHELSQVTDIISAGSGGAGGAGSSTGTTSVELQRANIKARADLAQKEIAQNKAILQGQIDFLTSYVGGNNALAKGIEKSTATADAKKAAADLKQLQADQQALLNSQLELQQKIFQFNGSIEAKAETPQQAALTKINDQFAAINFQISQANLKYDEFIKKHGQAGIDSFNSNPANVVKLAKTNPLSAAILNAAVDDQANLNENSYIQKDIDTKKKLYADYQAYREKVGKDIADAEYEDLLKSGKDYQTYLDNISKAIPSDDVSGPIQQRRQIVLTAQQQAAEDQKKALERLLEGIKTYETQKAALTATYEDKRTQLFAAGRIAEVAQLDLQYKQDLGRLNDSNFEKLTAVRELMTGVADLSSKQAQDLINKVTQELAKADGLTSDEIKKIKKTLAEAQLSIDNRVPDELIATGAALSTIGKDFQSINSDIGTMLSGLGSTLVSLGNLDKAFNQLTSDQKNSKDTTSDYINVISSGIQGLISLISTISSAAAQRKQAAADYYNSVIAFQGQYNAALNEQIRLQYQLQGNIFITDHTAELKDAAKALTDANSKFNDSLSQLSQGQAIVGTKNVVNGKNVLSSAGSGALAGAAIGSIVPGIGTVVGGVVGGIAGAIAGIFGGKTKADVLAPLLVTYPDLIKKATDGTVSFNEALAKSLIANNQVSASTKVLLQNTIDLNDARQAAIDQIDSAFKELSTNLGTNLENALVTAFENGTSAAQAFGASVSDVIGNIVQQFLFEDVFGSQFDKLQKTLQQTVEAGGSQADITADFVKFFKEAGPLVTQFNDGLKAAQQAGATEGLTLFQPSTTSGGSANNLTGAIKGITAEQADLLAGQFGGLRLTQLQTNEILTKTMADNLAELRNQTLVQMQIAIDVKRTADVSVENLPYLKDIANNTSSGNLTSTLRAIGV